MIMFSKENIVFDVNRFFVEQYCKNKDQIIDSIYVLTNTWVEKLNISSLNQITVKDIQLFDNELGKVDFSIGSGGLVSNIYLSYSTAVNLVKDSPFYTAAKYNNAYATFCHEIYHVYDREQLLKRSSIFVNMDKSKKAEILAGLKIWTEFFAAYSTFEICEQTHVYDDFDSSLHDWPLRVDKISYNISRLLGYHLKSGHSIRCDTLIAKLNSKFISSIESLLKEMLAKYPVITANDLTTLKSVLDYLIPICAQ